MTWRRVFTGLVCMALVLLAHLVPMAKAEPVALEGDTYRGIENAWFKDVSCSSATNCWAVGARAVTPQRTAALAVRWNGADWTVASVPMPAGTRSSYLSAVSCVSSSDCWAAGGPTQSQYQPAPTEVVFEHWNGSAWLLVPLTSKPPETRYLSLSRIWCVTASDCMAVGNYYANADPLFVPLAEHWNGSRWSDVPVPKAPGPVHSSLSAVSCVTGSDCWAVGVYWQIARYSYTFAEHWDGSRWTIVPTPKPANSPISDLSGVFCAAVDDCLAVGAAGTYSGYDPEGRLPTLIEAWNGKAWSIVQSPNTSWRINDLAAVSCGTRCFAVGGSASAYGADGVTLIEEWNGASWKVVPSPNVPGSHLSQLNAVACDGDQCFAVGMSVTPREVSIIERWNGTSWQLSTTTTTVPTTTTTTVPTTTTTTVPTTTTTTVKVLSTSTGKPWSSGLYWLIVSLIGVIGAGILVASGRRRRAGRST